MANEFQSRIFSPGFLEGEEFEAFKRDIILLNKINPDSLEKLIEIIKVESAWYESYKLQSSYDTGLLTFLKGIGTTVELRGVFNREIEFGENLEDYKKCVEINNEKPVIPTITIALNQCSPAILC